jgi:hypothetical protein
VPITQDMINEAAERMLREVEETAKEKADEESYRNNPDRWLTVLFACVEGGVALWAEDGILRIEGPHHLWAPYADELVEHYEKIVQYLSTGH